MVSIGVSLVKKCCIYWMERHNFADWDNLRKKIFLIMIYRIVKNIHSSKVRGEKIGMMKTENKKERFG